MPKRRGWDGAQPREDYVLSHLDLAAGDAVAQVVPMTADIVAGAETTSEKILARVLSSLEDDKAEDVVTIDLAGRSAMSDHMVICSGRSSRQVSSMAEKLSERLKTEFGVLCKIEGKEQGDWVLLDSGDVIVHLFRPEVRDFYQLEKMWVPTGDAV